MSYSIYYVTLMKRLVKSSQVGKNFASCLPSWWEGEEGAFRKGKFGGLNFVQTFDAIRAANRFNVLNSLLKMSIGINQDERRREAGVWKVCGVRNVNY